MKEDLPGTTFKFVYLDPSSLFREIRTFPLDLSRVSIVDEKSNVNPSYFEVFVLFVGVFRLKKLFSTVLKRTFGRVFDIHGISSQELMEENIGSRKRECIVSTWFFNHLLRVNLGQILRMNKNSKL